jgi:acyl-CoA reductase-like NAD-dependent aldehyde dehydrogenase
MLTAHLLKTPASLKFSYADHAAEQLAAVEIFSYTLKEPVGVVGAIIP